MKSELRKYWIVGGLVVAFAFIGVLVHFARADADDQSTSPPATAEKTQGESNADSPTDSVKTAVLTQGEMAQNIVAFGSVIAQPDQIAVFSVSYDCRVRHLSVTAGQTVDKGAALIDIEPSPAARLSLLEAQSNLDAANKDMAQSQQRFNMKLATNSDLLQSQQALQLAQLRLDNLKQQGLDPAPDSHHVLSAQFAGLLARIDVQQGQIVPAGNPLVETIARDQVEVRLGVEPTEIHGLSTGQDVQLFPVNEANPNPLAGKVRLVTQRVNPDTRLVDVFITPQNADNLLLDGFVRAQLRSATTRALIAPRAAVLPDEDGYTLFTVKDGKAVKHAVKVGLENDTQTQVLGDGLSPGDIVVTQGNYELEDGMAVSTNTTAEAKP